MTDDWREELIEKMKTALVNARLMGADYKQAARAALAVAEPVIRERCAAEANDNLCAAAPDLYEATTGWVDVIETLVPIDDVTDEQTIGMLSLTGAQIRKLIWARKKARGEI